jgi:biopolymer transport protein ExbB
MLELIRAGGWMMLPILLCSLVFVAVFIERSWNLREQKVLPKGLTDNIWKQWRQGQCRETDLNQYATQSPLGAVLAAVIRHADAPDERRSLIEETGRHVAHRLERYLSTVGIIAEIAPLLGLLGTVIGMIKVFLVITEAGTGDAAMLAGGISEALISTASGLLVAIPAFIAHRALRRRVDGLVIAMEAEASRLLDAVDAAYPELKKQQASAS